MKLSETLTTMLKEDQLSDFQSFITQLEELETNSEITKAKITEQEEKLTKNADTILNLQKNYRSALSMIEVKPIEDEVKQELEPIETRTQNLINSILKEMI